MTSKGTSRGGRRLTLYAAIGGQVFALARNILLARILGPEEFGVAAVVILTITFLDSFANAGPQNLLVQAKDEDGRPLLAAAHAVTIGRGVSTALLLLAFAMPLSHLMGLQLGWAAIIGLAVSALVSGGLHRGVRMVQREGNFRPEAISQLSGDFAALVIAVPVAIVTKSHIAIVAGLVARSAVTVLLSHWLAPQRYEVNWDRSHLRRFWNFGWPLLINGPLLFLSAQADRLFISRELGMETLGIYSAVLVLVASPSTAVLRWLGTIYIPPLAKVFHETGALRPRGVVFEYTAAMLLLGLLMFTGFATLGSFVVGLLYGDRYEVAAPLIALVGALQVLRFLRAWPSTLALSVAASGGILVSTMIRLLALPIGFGGLIFIGGLEGLLAGLIAGEALALLVSLLIVNRNSARDPVSGVAPVFLFLILIAGVTWAVDRFGTWLPAQLVVLAVASALGALLLCVSVSPQESFAYAKRLVSTAKARARPR